MVKIVRATAAHLADARLLLEEYYETVSVVKRDSPEDISNLLAAASSGFWIAYMGWVPAGCVMLRPLRGIASSVECKRLYVRAGFRGRGLADRLLDAMEAHAQAAGASSIYLDSMHDMEAALGIYRRRGYQECIRYNDNPQATIFLRKDLLAFPSI